MQNDYQFSSEKPLKEGENRIKNFYGQIFTFFAERATQSGRFKGTFIAGERSFPAKLRWCANGQLSGIIEFV